MTGSARKESARNAQGTGMEAAVDTATAGTPERIDQLLVKVVERTNMQQTYDRVVSNRGRAEIDGLNVADLKDYLKDN